MITVMITGEGMIVYVPDRGQLASLFQYSSAVEYQSFFSLFSSPFFLALFLLFTPSSKLQRSAIDVYKRSSESVPKVITEAAKDKPLE